MHPGIICSQGQVTSDDRGYLLVVFLHWGASDRSYLSLLVLVLSWYSWLRGDAVCQRLIFELLLACSLLGLALAGCLLFFLTGGSWHSEIMLAARAIYPTFDFKIILFLFHPPCLHLRSCAGFSSLYILELLLAQVHHRLRTYFLAAEFSA